MLDLEDGIVRALEDVENSLVALRDERQRAEILQSAPRHPPRPRSAARNRSTTAARSISCRCSIAQRARLRCASSANDSHTQLLLDSVQLYKALGGGWQAFEPATQPASAATTPTPKS